MGRRNGTPVILAFGGFDPTGGAGVLMDSRAAAAAGAHASAVVSCLTVQTTASFSRFASVPRDVLDESLAAAAKSFPLRAVKVGMVGTRAAAEAILTFVAAHRDLPLVLDPVLRSSSGAPLLSSSALPAYRRLLRRAAVLTPNLPEAEKLLDRRIDSFADAADAAEELAELKHHFPTLRDAVDYIMDTFPIVRRKDEAKWGTYRTKDTILGIYAALAESQRGAARGKRGAGRRHVVDEVVSGAGGGKRSGDANESVLVN